MNCTDRCPDCGSPVTMKHLRNCKTNGSTSFRSNSNDTATRAQLDLVGDLIKGLGYNEDDYNLDVINSLACGKLIEQLIAERG